MSSVLLGEPPLRDQHRAPAPGVPSGSPAGALSGSPAGALSSDGAGQRNNTLTVIAGVGVLLLAMGVGVLIGRSGASKQRAAAPQVISVASSPSTGTATTPLAAAAFTGDWPSGKTGYTVQLQTLPQSGATVSAVEGAKSAASVKGAKGVGALKSEEFSSLSAGNYVIYSGGYQQKSEADEALAGLKKSFPGAQVVKVSNGGSSSSTGDSGPSAAGAGSSESHPAPSSVLKSLKGVKGKSYEEKSKALPDVVETG